MSVMDITKLQSILMARGIRISNDDPIFTLIALNEIVLDDMTNKHIQTFTEVDKRVVENLCAIVNKTVSQIAQSEAEARMVMATTKKAMWIIGGGLAGMGMFGLGVSYGAIYSTWTNPEWINRTGLLSVLTSALLKTPIGGVGLLVLALALIFLEKNITHSVAESDADETVLKIIIYLSATIFSAAGFWLSFLMMFK